MIEKVERFCCKRCGYITEDPLRIRFIKEHHEYCPACDDGKPAVWDEKEAVNDTDNN